MTSRNEKKTVRMEEGNSQIAIKVKSIWTLTMTMYFWFWETVWGSLADLCGLHLIIS